MLATLGLGYRWDFLGLSVIWVPFSCCWWKTWQKQPEVYPHHLGVHSPSHCSCGHGHSHGPSFSSCLHCVQSRVSGAWLFLFFIQFGAPAHGMVLSTPRVSLYTLAKVWTRLTDVSRSLSPRWILIMLMVMINHYKCHVPGSWKMFNWVRR